MSHFQDCQLSEHFYLSEFCRSDVATKHGISIVVEPGCVIYKNLEILCNYILEPVRFYFGQKPVTITSGVRPVKVNRLVGGSATSAHIDGRAADFIINGISPRDICLYIANNNKYFDQVINEYGQWTHAGIARPGERPRRQYYTASRVIVGNKHRTRYSPWL